MTKRHNDELRREREGLLAVTTASNDAVREAVQLRADVKRLKSQQEEDILRATSAFKSLEEQAERWKKSWQESHEQWRLAQIDVGRLTAVSHALLFTYHLTHHIIMWYCGDRSVHKQRHVPILHLVMQRSSKLNMMI
jgi:hypothetical protein